MYGWLWRHLPGPTAVKILECLILLGLVVALLLLAVFPWAEANLPFLQVTVDVITPRVWPS